MDIKELIRTHAGKEEWRWVPGYVGCYKVSNFGRVKSFKKRPSKFLKPLISQAGYYYVFLCNGVNDKIKQKIHTLVMLAFVGPRPEGLSVAHNNGVKTNNCLTNLRYCTPLENTQDNFILGTYRRSYTYSDQEISKMRSIYAEGVAVDEIVEIFGISRPHLMNVLKNKSRVKESP